LPNLRASQSNSICNSVGAFDWQKPGAADFVQGCVSLVFAEFCLGITAHGTIYDSGGLGIGTAGVSGTGVYQLWKPLDVQRVGFRDRAFDLWNSSIWVRIGQDMGQRRTDWAGWAG